MSRASSFTGTEALSGAPSTRRQSMSGVPPKSMKGRIASGGTPPRGRPPDTRGDRRHRRPRWDRAAIHRSRWDAQREMLNTSTSPWHQRVLLVRESPCPRRRCAPATCRSPARAVERGRRRWQTPTPRSKASPCDHRRRRWDDARQIQVGQQKRDRAGLAADMTRPRRRPSWSCRRCSGLHGKPAEATRLATWRRDSG